jgi:mono/diheme cytochrome c family protein
MSDPLPPAHAPVEPARASDDSLQSVHAQLLHRRPERAHGFPKLPLLLLGVLSAALLAGALYLAHHAGGFDPLIANENIRPPKGGFGTVQVTVTPAMLGKRVYLANCIQCHQTTGLGVPGTYPPLAASDWVAGPEERLVRIVLHGVSGPITVSGKEYNNPMTPLGALLKDEQIANVLTYVRSEWGNTAPEVKPETVAKVRAETASRNAPWTAAELLKIGR